MIRKFSWLYIPAIVLIFFYKPAFSMIESAASSGMSTVFASGAADAGRNPALMPLQKDPIYLLLGIAATPSTTLDARNHMNMTGPSTDTYMTIPSTDYSFTSLSIPLGFSFNGERSGFGILLTSDGALYSKTKIKSAGGIVDPLPLYGQITGTTTITEYNPSLETSWGIRTGDTSTFGIRLTSTFHSKIEDSNIDYSWITGSLDILPHKEKKESSVITGTLHFGFHYEKDGVEAGATISTPTFAKQSVKYTGTDSSGSYSDKANKFITLTGPEFTIGFSYPLINSVKMYLEISSQMPMTYKFDDFSFTSSSTAHSVDKTSTEYQGKYHYTSHLGFKFTKGDFNFIIGLSGTLEERGENVKSGTGSDQFTQIKSYGFAESTGFEFVVAERTSLGISTIGTFYKQTGRSSYYDNASNTSQITRTKLNLFQLETLAGIQFKI
jgi:hypothetical protein